MKTALFSAPKFRLAAWAAGVLALALGGQPAFGQAEVTPWGNINGLRVSGQVLEFESSLQLVRPGWAGVVATAQERQRPRYARQGRQQLITTRLDSLALVETVEDLGPGRATVVLDATALAATDMQGAFFSLALPPIPYAQATVQLLDATGRVLAEQPLAAPTAETQVPARRVRVVAGAYQVELAFAEPTQVLLRRPEGGRAAGPCRLYVPIQLGALAKGQAAHLAFTLSGSGPIDRAPIHLTLNPAQPGRPFAGFGGNFRLQNPKGDPQVIDYCLQHLRVAWGRVEMPWQLWQPDLAQDPTAAAAQGQLHPHVRESMEMAQRLSKKGIPVIVTAWSAPQWAIVGPRIRGGGPGPDGIWGNPLDKNTMQASYKSIADYIVYLKEKYGVEVAMFSFNESDLGINIRQTGQEHDELIKGLGAYFVARGLKTKLLLGDNSDATTYDFINPALHDPAARPYIGAVSFHSWRGCDDATLAKWAAASREIELPLLVGEGSIDAQAWGYPAIFEESSYALQEITLYTRLLAQCQPLSILQWQLTSDYSPLAGGGIYGNPAPLHPTQRFFNLQQLANTPPDVVALPLTTDRPNLACAALGNRAKGVYALHLVNNGATRPVTLTGLPATVKNLRVFVTDKTRAVQEGPRLAVAKGTAHFTLEAGTYVTLESR